MNTTTIALFTGILLTTSCKKEVRREAAADADSDGMVTDIQREPQPQAFTTANWTAGALPVTTNPLQLIVPNDRLLPLGVTLGGAKIYKSNNPEIFRGNGWLMQNSRTDATRGGSSFALTGTNPVYLFHINKSGVTKWLHLLVTNPNASAITVSSKGSCYTNTEKPLTGTGTGQSYFVAKDWLNNTLRQPQTTATSLAQYAAKEIFKIQVNNSSMVDGRFEITTSGNAYYYTVITGTGATSDAVTASQGAFAAGDYYTESTNTYGREAGIYNNSTVSAENDLDIPNTASHIGFALNTSSKFFSAIENQTATASTLR